MSDLTRNVAIYIFDEVEVLDFCGPFEVFSVAGARGGPERPFNVYTVARAAGPVAARNALSVNPRYSFADCPRADILVVPGGYGTRREMTEPEVLDWIADRARGAEVVLSVCTGSLILAKAGLLEGLEATTHHLALAELREAAPRTAVAPEKRFIDNGRIVTAAGISAGIDAAFHVVARLLGREQAAETAAYMEYDWKG